MELLMIGHWLGDFYFQTDSMAENKTKSIQGTALHCLIYSVVMYIVLVMGTGRGFKYISMSLLIGILHLCIDGIKCIVHKVYKLEKYQLIVFFIDQMIHVVLLYAIAYIYTITIDISWLPGISDGIINGIYGYLVIIGVFLFCGKPASVIVSKVFDMIPKTIQEAQGNDEGKTEKGENEVVKIGSWIGILEREIMLILGLMGEYGAIGFVIAAKSLARHKQFDTPAFAEKYLIGTLLSSLMALICIVVYSGYKAFYM